jgi:hypothetical protein
LRDFFGSSLVVKPSPVQFSSDAELPPIRPFDQRIGHTQTFTDALNDPREADRTEQRVLEEIVRLSCDPDKSSHERYLAVFQLIQRRDRELADTFDELRLSTQRAKAMVCEAVRVRNPSGSKATERDANSATFISLQAHT